MTVVVDFPLRGEWRASNTPAERVPSHGTDFFGQRYAFDFVRMDESGYYHYTGGNRALLRHLCVGLPASRFLCWDQPVHSVAAGRVVAARDGWPDRGRVHLLWELTRTTFMLPPRFDGDDYRPLAGNYVIVEGADGIALYAHLREGTVCVGEGDVLHPGQVIGRVGNSGNSTLPHLHFHLMDGIDPLRAAGIRCAFREYERWQGNAWERVEAGIPELFERVRAGG